MIFQINCVLVLFTMQLRFATIKQFLNLRGKRNKLDTTLKVHRERTLL